MIHCYFQISLFSASMNEEKYKGEYDRIFFFYLFIWLLQVLVSSMQDLFIMACKLLEAYGIYFPDWGYNSGLLHWEHGVLTTDPWGKSLKIFFEIFKVRIIIFFTNFLNCFKGFSGVNTFISICQCNQNMAADKWRVLMIEQNLSETFLYGTFLSQNQIFK